MAYSFPSCLDRTYLEGFLLWPVGNQGRAQFCSFGAVGEMRQTCLCAFSYWLIMDHIHILSIQTRTVNVKKPSHAIVSLTLAWVHAGVDSITRKSCPVFLREVFLQCKDKIPKFRNKYSQKRNIGVSAPFPHSCVCEWFIYSHDRSAYSPGENM